MSKFVKNVEIEKLQQAAIFVSSDGIIERVNSKFCEFLNWKHSDILKQNIAVLIPTKMIKKTLHDEKLKSYKLNKESKIVGKPRVLPVKNSDDEEVFCTIQIIPIGTLKNHCFLCFFAPVYQRVKYITDDEMAELVTVMIKSCDPRETFLDHPIFEEEIMEAKEEDESLTGSSMNEFLDCFDLRKSSSPSSTPTPKRTYHHNQNNNNKKSTSDGNNSSCLITEIVTTVYSFLEEEMILITKFVLDNYTIDQCWEIVKQLLMKHRRGNLQTLYELIVKYFSKNQPKVIYLNLVCQRILVPLLLSSCSCNCFLCTGRSTSPNSNNSNSNNSGSGSGSGSGSDVPQTPNSTQSPSTHSFSSSNSDPTPKTSSTRATSPIPPYPGLNSSPQPVRSSLPPQQQSGRVVSPPQQIISSNSIPITHPKASPPSALLSVLSQMKSRTPSSDIVNIPVIRKGSPLDKSLQHEYSQEIRQRVNRLVEELYNNLD